MGLHRKGYIGASVDGIREYNGDIVALEVKVIIVNNNLIGTSCALHKLRGVCNEDNCHDKCKLHKIKVEI